MGTVAAWFIAAFALIAGLLAWFKVLSASVRLVGLGRWIFDVIWSLVGPQAWRSRWLRARRCGAARAGLPPVYARPYWMFLMPRRARRGGVTAARIGAATAAARAASSRSWSIALPVPWGAAAGACIRADAGHATFRCWLAGLVLSSPAQPPWPWVASVIVPPAAGTVWAPDVASSSPFVVALLGWLPLITPFWCAAILLVCGLAVAPPFIAIALGRAAAAGRRPHRGAADRRRDADRPGARRARTPTISRRSMRVLVEAKRLTATTTSRLRNRLDLDAGAPGALYRTTVAPAFSAFLVGISSMPFVFRTTDHRRPPPRSHHPCST